MCVPIQSWARHRARLSKEGCHASPSSGVSLDGWQLGMATRDGKHRDGKQPQQCNVNASVPFATRKIAKLRLYIPGIIPGTGM